MERIITNCLNVAFVLAFLIMTYTNIQSFKQTKAMSQHFADASLQIEIMKEACRPQQKQSQPKVRLLEVETILWTF